MTGTALWMAHHVTPAGQQMTSDHTSCFYFKQEQSRNNNIVSSGGGGVPVTSPHCLLSTSTSTICIYYFDMVW